MVTVPFPATHLSLLTLEQCGPKVIPTWAPVEYGFVFFHESATGAARPALNFGAGRVGFDNFPAHSGPTQKAGQAFQANVISPGRSAPPPPESPPKAVFATGPASSIFPCTPSRHEGKRNCPPSAGKLAARSRPKRGGNRTVMKEFLRQAPWLVPPLGLRIDCFHSSPVVKTWVVLREV